MICANILIYYLLVTCCCCSLQLVSAAASSSSSSSVNQQQANHHQQKYLSLAEAGSAEGQDPAASLKDPQSGNHQNHHNVHKHMSEKDLRRTFQVDSHDQVPEYEVLKLQVNSDGSHLISPISDLGELLAGHQHQAPATLQSTASPSSSSSFPQQQEEEEQEDEQVQTNSRHKRETTTDHRTRSDNKLIVIDLSTFGKDFKLRLKRNADFQQRIKDMKMFMAESTQDGQLKYTEVSHPLTAAGKHKQEPHKRATTADDESDANEPQAATGDKKQQATKESSSGSNKQTGGWNIGSTYHDEDNLAALLIDHDKKTGQLQIEGTIGNDFVIKPMPKATIEALLLARRSSASAADGHHNKQAAEQQLASAESNSTTSRLDKSAASPSAPAPTPASAANNTTGGTGVGQQQQQTTSSGPAVDLDRAIHMHDDDPHDDDEMFLDEDEAIELAQLQPTATNRTIGQHYSYHSAAAAATGNHTTSTYNIPHQAGAAGAASYNGSARTLSKAASERKWNKYRKLLLAQTQVPKIQQLAISSEQSSFPSSTSGGSQTQRVRRQVAPSVSHHIVFRQKSSSDESSAAHQHSFMISPGDSMERLASSFNQARRDKRDAPLADEHPSSRLMLIDGEEADADAEHDPLGGQFYLEPASLTGFERAGHTDWSFRAPYSTASFNNTNANGTTATGKHRFKRQARAPSARGGSQVRRKRQAPDTVWPEVLLVVDYDSFLLHGGDSRDVKRYFVSFWNGVDLRYKLLVHPHIRISLAGMIVAKDRDATPYLERNRLRAPNADAVDAAGALTDMGKYLYREDRLPTYDLAVVITKLDMCRRRFEGGRCNRGTAGFAYVGGACVVNKRLEKVNSVAIIEDSGGFSGIIVAAHEVGHLLGCVHDGSPPPSYLGGPGATHCPWEDGFIMSDLRHTERGFRWSQCSVEQFKHFLNGETATCLYNYPHESQMLQRLLPGSMLTLDEQCKRDRGTNACFKDARVCAQLFCFDSASGYCVSYRPAAEGSPCGEGQVCRNGKCVGDIENIIPDYTHQSQTVVARGRSASAGAGHGLARLADNGLSASSTSTATSSPDGKPTAAIGSQPASQAAPPAISSRMDTYPMDSPLIGASPALQQHFSSAGYSSQFGGRQFGGGHTTVADSMTSSSAGVVMSRQRHPGGLQVGSTTQPRSAKLMASEPATRQKVNKLRDQQQQQYQQRSGPVQVPASNQGKSRGLQQKSRAKQAGRGGGGGLGTSASTISSQRQQQSPSIGSSSSTSVSHLDSSINDSSSDSNLLAHSQNQFDHHQQKPSTSSIQTTAANIKQRSAAHTHTTTPRHSTATTSQEDGGHVNSSRKQQLINVNHHRHHHYQKAQLEPQRTSSNSKALHGSSALYLTSASSQYHPVSIAATAVAAAA